MIKKGRTAPKKKVPVRSRVLPKFTQRPKGKVPAMATTPRHTSTHEPTHEPAHEPEQEAKPATHFPPAEEFEPPIPDDRKRFLLQQAPSFAEVQEAGDIKRLIKEGLLKITAKKVAELTEKGKAALAALAGGTSTP